MIPLTNEENVIYANVIKGFSTDDNNNMVMIIKSIRKPEIIVATQENIENLLIVFIVEDIKHQKKFK